MDPRPRIPVAVLVCAALVALPTLLTFYPPMTDLPEHEGIVGLLRHWGDETYAPHGLYHLNLGHPNQLFYGASWLLSWAVGTRWAVKLVIALSQFAIFWAGARFAIHRGRSPWAALLLAPMALGYTYYWGLVANLIGFAAFLWCLPLLEDRLAKPTARTVAESCGLMLLLYFAHESVLVLGGLALGFFALLRPLSVKATALRLVPCVFGAALVIAQLVYQNTRPNALVMSVTMSKTYYMPLLPKIESMPNVLFGSHEPIANLLLVTVALLAVAALLAARWKEVPTEGQVEELPEPVKLLPRARLFAYRYRVEIVGFGLLVGFFVAPMIANGATLIHERFLGPAWCLLVLGTPPRGEPTRLGKLVAVMVPVAILLVGWPQFADSNEAYGDLQKVAERLPKGKTFAAVIVDRSWLHHTRVFSATTFSGRLIAERGGRAPHQLTTSTISPVLIAPEYDWNELEVRVFLKGATWLFPETDFRRIEYLVVESRDPVSRALIDELLSKWADLVIWSGEFQLFHSRLPPDPLLSPGRKPNPGDKTLEDQLQELVAQKQKELREREAKERGGIAPMPPPAPSGMPSAAASGIPSAAPSVMPSAAASGMPSAAPSGMPSAGASGMPSAAPSGSAAP